MFATSAENVTFWSKNIVRLCDLGVLSVTSPSLQTQVYTQPRNFSK
jgi:hypothetical protein